MFQQILDTNIRDVPNFIRTSLSSSRSLHWEMTHDALNEILKKQII